MFCGARCPWCDSFTSFLFSFPSATCLLHAPLSLPTDKAPVIQTDDSRYREEPALNYLVPDDPNVGYDMGSVIEKVVDRDSLFEIMPTYAKNIICGFARMEGRTVAVVANNPLHLAGCLDIDASVKVCK